MNYPEAEAAASAHRGAYGDDVIRHDPEDEGWGFVCEDCGWVVVYVPFDEEAAWADGAWL